MKKIFPLTLLIIGVIIYACKRSEVPLNTVTLDHTVVKPPTGQKTIDVFKDLKTVTMYTQGLGAADQMTGSKPVTDPETYFKTPAGITRVSNTEYEKKYAPGELSKLIAPTSKITLRITISAVGDYFDRNFNVYFASSNEASANELDYYKAHKVSVYNGITPFYGKFYTEDKRTETYDVDISYLSHQFSSGKQIWLGIDGAGWYVHETYNPQHLNPDGTDPDKNIGFLVNMQLIVDNDAKQDNPFWQPVISQGVISNTSTPKNTLDTSFVLEEDARNARLELTTTGHGAAWPNGEEYTYRQHYVYLDGNKIKDFSPQIHGCFMGENRTWCPGTNDQLYIIELGDLKKGRHELKIEIPDLSANGEYRLKGYLLYN